MTTQATISSRQGNHATPLFGETGRLLPWRRPTDALDMSWQFFPLQSSGRTVPELCQNSGTFTNYQFGRKGDTPMLLRISVQVDIVENQQLLPGKRVGQAAARSTSPPPPPPGL